MENTYHVVLEKNDIMIYVSSKNLYRMISPIAIEHVKFANINDKNLKFSKNDVIITQNEAVSKIAKKKKIMNILVLKNNYYSSQDKEYFDFFITEKNLNPLVFMLIENDSFEGIKFSNRDNIINFVFDPSFKHVLLLHRNKSFWGYEPVKGGIEKNETPKKAVIRETYEECGLNITSPYRLPKKIGYNSIQFDTKTIRKISAIIFISKIDKKTKFTIREKSAKMAFKSLRWVPLKEAKNLFALPRYRLAFSYVLKNQDLINKK